MNRVISKSLTSILILIISYNGISQSLDPILENPQIVEINNPTNLQNFKNEVVFKNVNFEYFAVDGPVLDNNNIN